MDVCKTCGAPLEDGTRFCQNCGAPVQSGAETVTPDIVPETTPDTMPDFTADSFSNPQPDSVSETPDDSSTFSQDNTYGNAPVEPNTAYNPPQSQPQQPYGQTGYGTPQQGQQGYTSNPYGGYNQPQGYPQQNYNPYVQPGYGAPQQSQPSNGKCIASLILGIASILMGCCYGGGIVFGIIGLVLANLAKKEIEGYEAAHGPMQNNSKGMRTAGMVCSIIGIVISVIMIICVIIAAVVPGIASELY
jgi:hypothetical protein